MFHRAIVHPSPCISNGMLPSPSLSVDIPQAKPALEKSQFGSDALQKAERALSRGRGAVAGNDRDALENVAGELDRTINLFRGLARSRPAGHA